MLQLYTTAGSPLLYSRYTLHGGCPYLLERQGRDASHNRLHYFAKVLNMLLGERGCARNFRPAAGQHPAQVPEDIHGDSLDRAESIAHLHFHGA